MGWTKVSVLLPQWPPPRFHPENWFLQELLAPSSWTPVLQEDIRVKKELPLMLGPLTSARCGFSPWWRTPVLLNKGSLFGWGPSQWPDRRANKVSRPQRKVSCQVQRKKAWPMQSAPIGKLIFVKLKPMVYLRLNRTNNLVWNFGPLVCTWWQQFPAL